MTGCDLFGPTGGAELSPCRRYRYRLWRRVSAVPGTAVFVLLNPSTADESADDPTVIRCAERVRRLHLGELVIVNLFAWRTTAPAELAAVPDPIGPANDAAILDACRTAAIIIAGWGGHGCLRDRAASVRTLLQAQGVPLQALRLTGDGEPAHPLYLPYSLAPRPIGVLAASPS